MTLFGTTAHHIRQGKDRAIIARQKCGSTASMLDKEIQILNEEVKSILRRREHDAPIKGAAYYHLRLENIHPLRDGNGRVGRLIMAAQCSDAYGFPIYEMLRQCDASSNDYMMAVSAPKPEFQFELLTDVLARFIAIPLDGEALLEFPLEPRYPQATKAKRGNGMPSSHVRSRFF
jgi:Fic family protein